MRLRPFTHPIIFSISCTPTILHEWFYEEITIIRKHLSIFKPVVWACHL
jgi:hypothetical protein